MARMLREALDLVLGARTAPLRERETSSPAVDWAGVDWEDAYRARPEALERVMRTLDPGFSVKPPIETAGSSVVSPRVDSSLGVWLRDSMMVGLETINRKIDRVADPKTGMVPDAALKGGEFRALKETVTADAKRFITELRAGADTVVALMQTGRPMHDLILAAKAGDDDALLAAVGINPDVIDVDAIDARVRRAVKARDRRFQERLGRALRLGLALQKNAKVGFILTVLWEAGLKRLSSREIRGFLGNAGFDGVPSSQALERCAQRLGLKKYLVAEPRGSRRRGPPTSPAKISSKRAVADP